MNYAQKAQELFLRGYNCSQAVVCAFCDRIGMDEKAAARMACSFGGGVCRLREVCGAVSGMAMVAGLLYGYDSPDAKEEKALHYKRVQAMAGEFREVYGSIVCRELLKLPESGASEPTPEARNPAYYKKRRTCVACVGTAASIAEKLTAQNGEF